MGEIADTTSSIPLDDYRWLLSGEAETWLKRALQDTAKLATQISRLRRELSPERTHLVLELAALRRRGREKFSAAERMFFTSRGLEQATDETVASYKAMRFAGQGVVADLCCGIGGDLLAIGQRGGAVGVDRDPLMTLIVNANARAVVPAERFHTVEIITGDVADVDLANCDAWHIDPDRRPHGARTTRVELHDPPAEALDLLLTKNPRGAIKLAPAAEWPERWTAEAEFEWISRARQCRQLVAWFGTLATRPGERRATTLGNHGARSIAGQPELPLAKASSIDRYVYEPDAAVLAAKLEGVLAAEHQLKSVAAGIAYWTGPSVVADPLLACFEVEEVLPFDFKKLRAHLRSRGVGRLEIKVRGVEQDPAELRKKLRLTGDASATLLLTRIDKRATVIIARRHES